MAVYTENDKDLSRCCQCGEPIGDEIPVQVHVYGSHAIAMGLARCMHHVHHKCYEVYKVRWKKAEEE